MKQEANNNLGVPRMLLYAPPWLEHNYNMGPSLKKYLDFSAFLVYVCTYPLSNLSGAAPFMALAYLPNPRFPVSGPTSPQASSAKILKNIQLNIKQNY